MNCKVEFEGNGEELCAYMHRNGENYPRFYPTAYRVNVFLDKERAINQLPLCVAKLYFDGGLSVKELEELYITVDYLNFSNLIEILQEIANGFKTFDYLRRTLSENTLYDGRRVFKNNADIYAFNKTFEKALFLDNALVHNRTYESLPEYLGNYPYGLTIYDKDLCLYIANQVSNDNLNIIDEIFDIFALSVNNLEELLKKKYIYKMDIQKDFDMMKKRAEYYASLYEVKQSLWNEGVYKIGDDGYILNPEYGRPLFINHKEIPEIWEMDMPSASRMIVRNKFKLYACMRPLPQNFMTYWENLSDATKESLLKGLSKIKDNTYDFLLSYLSTS
jgi:hypothetical protein